MQCAVKILKKSKVLKNESRVQNLQHELEVLESICHPYIAHTYELLYDERNYYVVMELVRTGDLQSYLAKRNFQSSRLTENEVRKLAKQLFCAVAYLHENHIVHRDIKLKNILINSKNGVDPTIKLTDFGFATFCDQQSKLRKSVGSRNFLAPELMQKQSYDAKIDVWGASVVIYVLLTGNLPYPGNSISQIRK